MDKNTETTSSDNNNLIISGESETFDSWTILSDPKFKPKQSSTDVTIAASENEPSGIECVANEEEPQKIHENDDLSDGISVISECESADCLTSQTTIPSNLSEAIINENQNDNYKTLTPPNTPDTFKNQFSQTSKSGPLTTQDRITQYVELISSSSSSLDIDKQQQQQTVLSPIAANESPSQSSIMKILTVVRKPISKVFLISSLILSIAFFGNMKFTTNLNDWNLSTNVPQLHQRIENLELQNNLLRAEIDILSKSVNSISQQQQLKQKSSNYDYKDEKKKFKYENTNYQDNNEAANKKQKFSDEQREQQSELNGNERPPSPPPPPPPKNNNLPTYCKDGENLWCSQEIKNIEENDKQEINTNSNSNSNQNQSNYNNNNNSDDNKNYNKSSSSDSSSNDDKNFKEWQTKDFNKRKFDGRERNDSKENMKRNYEKKKFQHNSDDDDDDSSERYDSKEHFDKKRKNYENNKKYKNQKKHSDFYYHDDDDDDDSEERKFDKKRRDNRERYDSRELYDKRKNDGKQHQHYEKQKTRNNGDWHEKMMEQRENSRKNKNDKMDNNWYLERGNGREEARVIVKDEQIKNK